MKIIIRLILICILFISSVRAQTIGIRIPDTTAVSGSIIDIPIYVDSSLTGKNVLSYQLQINYYTLPISFMGIITTGTLSSGFSTPTYNINTNSGVLSISSAGSTALVGKGKLLFMRFQLNQAANIGFNFLNTSTCYFNQGLPLMNLKGGVLYINSLPTITAYFNNSSPIIIGESVQVSVSGGTSPYTYQVINSSVATISNSGVLTGIGAGKTKVRVQSSNGIIDTTDTNIEVRALKLTLPDTTVLPVSNIFYPVRINSTNSSNILSGSFRVNFSSSYLQPDSILLGNTLLQNAFVYYQVYNGYMLISFAKSSYLTGSGNLLRIRFKVLNSYNSGLSLQDILINQNTAANSSGGSIYFANIPTLTITPTTGEYYTNQTQQFNASGGISPYTFIVSDTSKGNITSNGLFTAKKGGLIKAKVMDSINMTASTNNLQIYDALLTLPNTSSANGKAFDYPVSISNLTGQRSIYSMSITITYTDNVLDSVEAFLTNTLASNWSISQNKISSNKIIIAIAGTTPINTNGILFRLRGKVKSNVGIGSNIYFYNSNVNFNQSDFYVKVIDGSMNIVISNPQLTLTAFLEGMYLGSNTMIASPYSADGISPVTIADTIAVELHQNASPYNLVYSARGTLSTSGIAAISFPFGASGNSYYIVVKHRNSIETWSASPIMFSASTSYTFSTSASQAYGSNLSNIGSGKFAIFSGDINQDGSVDFNDYPDLDISSNNGDLGYLPYDLNGDASIDFNDYPIIDINSNNGIITLKP